MTSCLALSLQPVEGLEILLQTQAWFPPTRAFHALKSFRETRRLDAGKGLETHPGSMEMLGDDPLAASSGQVVVGQDHKFLVVYRLVNTVYVLGIASADQDDLTVNVFDCARVVSQAVSALVTACRGIYVTAEKLNRRYSEVYLVLSAILHGVSQSRLKSLQQAIQMDPHSLLNSAPSTMSDMESKARGSLSWNLSKAQPLHRLSSVQLLSQVTFDLPDEAYAAGDEAMATFAPPPSETTFDKGAEGRGKDGGLIDPFAASDLIGLTADYSGGGGTVPAGTASDPMAQLAGLDIPQSTKPAGGSDVEFVAEEGFEGQYGGLEWSDGGDGFGSGEDLLGDDGGAWGGGLDASLFGADADATAAAASSFGGGLGSLEADILAPGRQLEAALAGDGPSFDSNIGARIIEESRAAALASEAAAQAAMPVLHVSEEISASFAGLALHKVGLRGTVHLTLPPSRRAKADTEFSFRLEGASGMKRAAVKGALVSSVGNGYFHVRIPASLLDSGVFPILKYSLQPKITPVPLRIRLHSRRLEDSLSLMIQYVANPFLQSPLLDVTFALTLPFSPASIKLNPSATLNRITKDLVWRVGTIEPKSSPSRLRAQIPIIPDHLIHQGPTLTDEERAKVEARKAKELSEFKVRVFFQASGFSLSGMVITAAGTSSNVFNLGTNQFQSYSYTCTTSAVRSS